MQLHLSHPGSILPISSAFLCKQACPARSHLNQDLPALLEFGSSQDSFISMEKCDTFLLSNTAVHARLFAGINQHTPSCNFSIFQNPATEFM